jgi:crossover junction endodeoxyribonuclease RuvC
MRILGIDPGLATTGWAIVDFEDNDINVVDFGVISTQKGRENPNRLAEIYDDLTQIINNFKPECAGVESLLFNNNAKTAMAVGEARGVVLLAIEKGSIPVYSFTPPQIKNSITGSGRADKKQVQENVMRICALPELPKPDDAADAIAVAITCFDSLKMSKLIE